MFTWALLEANCRPWGPLWEMSRGLERKWARGFAVHTAPAEFMAERRGGGVGGGAEGQRVQQGSPLSHFVNCSLEAGEEMNKA